MTFRTGELCLTRERRPEHRTRNGTGTERERTGTRTREMLVQHLRHSRLPSTAKQPYFLNTLLTQALNPLSTAIGNSKFPLSSGSLLPNEIDRAINFACEC